jgi:sodium-dependent phosphate cotransporter
MLSKLLYTHLVGSRQEQFQNIVFKNPGRAFGWGLLMTAIVQSSSLTTSLIVPLVATDKVRLERAFNFLMGANIGTTITAILAALFRSEAAMSLAIAHFLFNLATVLIYVFIPIIGKLPLYFAEKLGYLMFRYRIAAFAYITLVFFVIPFTLIYFSKSERSPTPQPIEKVKKLNGS